MYLYFMEKKFFKRTNEVQRVSQSKKQNQQVKSAMLA